MQVNIINSNIVAIVRQYDIVNCAQVTKTTSESTENLEVSLFCVHLLNYVIIIA